MTNLTGGVTLPLIREIWTWHEKTFPDFTAKEQELKLAEEIGEYSNAIDTLIATGLDSYLKKVQEELADVIIAAVNLLNYPEIEKLVRAKMEKNKQRNWQGGHHIEEEPSLLELCKELKEMAK